MPGPSSTKATLPPGFGDFAAAAQESTQQVEKQLKANPPKEACKSCDKSKKVALEMKAELTQIQVGKTSKSRITQNLNNSSSLAKYSNRFSHTTKQVKTINTFAKTTVSSGQKPGRQNKSPFIPNRQKLNLPTLLNPKSLNIKTQSDPFKRAILSPELGLMQTLPHQKGQLNASLIKFAMHNSSHLGLYSQNTPAEDFIKKSNNESLKIQRNQNTSFDLNFVASDSSLKALQINLISNLHLLNHLLIQIKQQITFKLVAMLETTGRSQISDFFLKQVQTPIVIFSKHVSVLLSSKFSGVGFFLKANILPLHNLILGMNVSLAQFAKMTSVKSQTMLQMIVDQVQIPLVQMNKIAIMILASMQGISQNLLKIYKKFFMQLKQWTEKLKIFLIQAYKKNTRNSEKRKRKLRKISKRKSHSKPNWEGEVSREDFLTEPEGH